MAVSKQIKRRGWKFFYSVLEHLIKQHPKRVPCLIKRLKPKLSQWLLVDSTTLEVARILKNRFSSISKGRAQVKLDVVVSAFTQIPVDYQIPAQRVNDKKFR